MWINTDVCAAGHSVFQQRLHLFVLCLYVLREINSHRGVTGNVTVPSSGIGVPRALPRGSEGAPEVIGQVADEERAPWG